MKLKNLVAIITGAATGIGRASAIAFAKEGARVIIADIKDKDAEEAIQLVRAAGNDAAYVRTDVTQLTQIENLVKTAVTLYGRLDIFFHNAGIAGPGALETTGEAAYDRVMSVNLKAGYFGAKYAVPEMRRAGGGSILFTSSGLGLRPAAQAPSYSMTKAGLIMLTRCLAIALAGDNIRVNAICPGPVDETPMWTDFVNRVPGTDPTAYANTSLQGRPIQRFGTAQEVARGALFLVSPENSYITGVALPIDGGGAAR